MKLLKTIVVLLAGTTLTTATALAQQVGTATAVNPESRTTPPGGSTVVLKVGAHVMHKERIKTTPTGSVQLLFLDRSTLTIAPNSDIVIDEFVYNPANGSGHMAVSLAKGAMRVVGGQLSHAGEATVNAGNATIGIRGGTGIFTTKEAININGTLTLPAGETSVLQNTVGMRSDSAGYPSRAFSLREPVHQQVWAERRSTRPHQREAQRFWYARRMASSVSNKYSANGGRS